MARTNPVAVREGLVSISSPNGCTEVMGEFVKGKVFRPNSALDQV